MDAKKAIEILRDANFRPSSVEEIMELSSVLNAVADDEQPDGFGDAMGKLKDSRYAMLNTIYANGDYSLDSGVWSFKDEPEIVELASQLELVDKYGKEEDAGAFKKAALEMLEREVSASGLENAELEYLDAVQRSYNALGKGLEADKVIDYKLTILKNIADGQRDLSISDIDVIRGLLDSNFAGLSDAQRSVIEEKIAKLEKGLNVENIDAEEVNKNLKELEGFRKELNEDKLKGKEIEEELKEVDDLLGRVQIDSKVQQTSHKAFDSERLPSEKFRVEVKRIATDEAIRKCALDKNFAKLKTTAEKQKAFVKARTEAVKDQVRQLMINQFGYDVSTSLREGKKMPSMDEMKAKANDFINAKSKKKISITKSVALSTMAVGIKENLAIGKLIAKRTGYEVTKLYNTAKSRRDQFKKDHPGWYNFTKSTLIGGGIAVTGMFVPPLGAAAAVWYGAHKTRASYRDLKAKYQKDEEYKGKSFGHYLKKHPLETTSLFASGALAGVTAVVGGATIYSAVNAAVASGASVLGAAATGGANLAEGAIDKAVVGWTRAALGNTAAFSNAARMYVAADNKKDKRKAVVIGAVSMAVATGMAFFANTEKGQEVTRKVLGWFGLGKGGNNLTPEGQTTQDTNTATVTNTDTTTTTTTTTNEQGEVVVVPVAEAESYEVQARVEPDQRVSDQRFALWQKRSSDDFGAEAANSYYKAIETGGVETIPDNMTKEEFLYKFNRMGHLAPWYQRETIDLIAKDLLYSESYNELNDMLPSPVSKESITDMLFSGGDKMAKFEAFMDAQGVTDPDARARLLLQLEELDCNKVKFTDAQLAEIHKSLGYMTDKGEYVGPGAGVGRTCNRPNGMSLENDCPDVKVVTDHIKGDCAETQIEPDTQKNVDVPGDDPDKAGIEEELETDTKPGTDLDEEKEAESEKETEKEQPKQEENKKKAGKDYLDIVYKNAPEKFAQDAINKGFIPDENNPGQMVHVGKEAAQEYVNQRIAEQNDFVNAAIDEKWAAPLDKDLHGKMLKKFAEGTANNDTFRAIDENGKEMAYYMKGGEFHKELADKWPKEYGQSYRDIQDFISNNAGASMRSASATQDMFDNNVSTSDDGAAGQGHTETTSGTTRARVSTATSTDEVVGRSSSNVKSSSNSVSNSVTDTPVHTSTQSGSGRAVLNTGSEGESVGSSAGSSNSAGENQPQETVTPPASRNMGRTRIVTR